MSDLVERLRSKTTMVNVSKAMFEAADEIERLRADVTAYRGAYVIQVTPELSDKYQAALTDNSRLRAALGVVDYALTNVWAIDREELKRAIADALGESDE